MDNIQDFTEILKQEFISRCQKNPQYSLRAFAKFLDIDQSYLSKIMRNQRTLSLKLAYKAGSALGYTASEVQKFFYKEDLLNQNEINAHLIQEDIFALSSDWFYFAILELLKTRGLKKDLAWIQSRLSLSKYEAEMAIRRLTRLGFIEINGSDIILIKENNTWVNEKNTNEARKNYQKQILKKAIEKIDSVDFSKRDQSSLTVAINPKDYKEIVQKITKLRKEINQISIRSKNNTNEVYQLSCSFFPLT